MSIAQFSAPLRQRRGAPMSSQPLDAPTPDVPVHLLAPALEQAMDLVLPPSLIFTDLQKAISANFTELQNVYYEIVTSSNEVVKSDSTLRNAHRAFDMAESARRRDVLEVQLEAVRQGLSAPPAHIELHHNACYALWELACHADNHKCTPRAAYTRSTHTRTRTRAESLH